MLSSIIVKDVKEVAWCQLHGWSNGGNISTFLEVEVKIMWYVPEWFKFFYSLILKPLQINGKLMKLFYGLENMPRQTKPRQKNRYVTTILIKGFDPGGIKVYDDMWCQQWR